MNTLELCDVAAFVWYLYVNKQTYKPHKAYAGYCLCPLHSYTMWHIATQYLFCTSLSTFSLWILNQKKVCICVSNGISLLPTITLWCVNLQSDISVTSPTFVILRPIKCKITLLTIQVLWINHRITCICFASRNTKNFYCEIEVLLYCLDATDLKLTQLLWPATRGRRNDTIRLVVWHIPY